MTDASRPLAGRPGFFSATSGEVAGERFVEPVNQAAGREQRVLSAPVSSVPAMRSDGVADALPGRELNKLPVHKIARRSPTDTQHGKTVVRRETPDERSRQGEPVAGHRATGSPTDPRSIDSRIKPRPDHDRQENIHSPAAEPRLVSRGTKASRPAQPFFSGGPPEFSPSGHALEARKGESPDVLQQVVELKGADGAFGLSPQTVRKAGEAVQVQPFSGSPEVNAFPAANDAGESRVPDDQMASFPVVEATAAVGIPDVHQTQHRADNAGRKNDAGSSPVLPSVHIGQIDVVVVAERGAPAASPSSATPSDFSSRNYLRRL